MAQKERYNRLPVNAAAGKSALDKQTTIVIKVEHASSIRIDFEA
jgi:hypothetical protein